MSSGEKGGAGGQGPTGTVVVAFGGGFVRPICSAHQQPDASVRIRPAVIRPVLPSLSFVKRVCLAWTVVAVAALCLPGSAVAQSPPAPFFVRIGAGISDYTGDFPAQNTGHPLDFQDFVRGTGLPVANTSEVGYRVSPRGALALGLQVGNYPIVGYAGDTGLKDSYRYTLQLMGRYRLGPARWPVRPYLDLGANLTFSGLETGYGPTVGGGAEVPLSGRLSFFVESRFNFVFPDEAADGVSGGSSSTGPADALAQLLGVGVRVGFGGPDPAPPAMPEGPATSGDSQTPDRGPLGQAPFRRAPVRADTTGPAGMVRVPSGTFIMGLTGEDPLSLQGAGRKRVTVSAFYLDQREVTNAEYRRYLQGLSPEARRERRPDSTVFAEARTQSGWAAYFRSDYYADYPVVGITWADARAFCQARGKRLPTEAEWERAARAGRVGGLYPWAGLRVQGEGGRYLANFKPSEGHAVDGFAFTAPTDTLKQNRWHLYHMAGNVAEWTRDAYTPLYEEISGFNPLRRDPEEPRRVVRGGAWNSRAAFIGVGMRDAQPKAEAAVDIGFRCAREVAAFSPEQASGQGPEQGSGSAAAAGEDENGPDGSGGTGSQE